MIENILELEPSWLAIACIKIIKINIIESNVYILYYFYNPFGH